MEQTKKYQKNWMLRAAAVLLCMVLISTWMLSGLMARYASGGSGNDSARTAAFVFHLQDGEETRYIDLSGITRRETVRAIRLLSVMPMRILSVRWRKAIISKFR